MKRTIGKNPLSEYLASTKDKQEQKSIKTKEIELSNDAALQEDKKLKQRVTIHISVDLIERVKNAVYWEPGLTMAGFAEQALTKALDKLEKEKGCAYPSRKEKQLRSGRPIS